jgi:integrase
MGVYRRPDSVFWWMALEGTPIRASTKIPLDGGSPAQNKELRRQAQALYAKRMATLAATRHQLPVTLDPRRFTDQRAWYAAHVTPQKRAPNKELSMLGILGRFFDEHELAAIDQALVREWRSSRLVDVSPSTVRREEALLRHVLSTAVPKYLERNPLAGLASVRVAKTDTRVLTRAEEARLLRATTGEDRALLVAALDTLLRLSNARTLRRQQDHGAYVFSDTKTDAIRIPVSVRLRALLDALPANGPHFFPTYAGPSNHATDKMFAAACRRARVTMGRRTGGISFHSLRHTGASRMLEAGADVKTVMEIGGWKNLKVLERYLHPSEDRKRAAVNTIGPHVPFTSKGRRRRKSRKTRRR